MTSMNILFIGGGNMSQAIIAGLCEQGFLPGTIFVVDKHEEKLAALQEQYDVNVSGSLEEFAPRADIIFLSVKPQGAKVACSALQPLIAAHNPLLISVMSGITLATLHAWLGSHVAIVRAMPNTPALIQQGATGLFALPSVSESVRQQATILLQVVGITAWLPHEHDLNTITALSGSGPAYYFYFIEVMRKTAIDMGLPYDIANAFALQTAYGAAALAQSQQTDVALLRQQVTSKNGTTEAALNVFAAQGLETIIAEALQACAARAVALSEAIA